MDKPEERKPPQGPLKPPVPPPLGKKPGLPLPKGPVPPRAPGAPGSMQRPPTGPPSAGVPMPPRPPMPGARPPQSPISGRPPLPPMPGMSRPGGTSGLSPQIESRMAEAEGASSELETKISELEKKLSEEREKVLIANLRSKEEEAVSAKVETSIKEIQDKLRREKREQEMDEGRRKAETRLAEMERRIAEEREAWVSTLKNQLGQRDQVSQEMESHFAARLKDLEYRWAQEKSTLESALRDREADAVRIRQEASLKTEQEKGFWEDRVRSVASDRDKFERELERLRDKVDQEKVQLVAERQMLRDQLSKTENSLRFAEEHARSDKMSASREAEATVGLIRAQVSAEKDMLERQMTTLGAQLQAQSRELAEKTTHLAAIEQQVLAQKTQSAQVEARLSERERMLDDAREKISHLKKFEELHRESAERMRAAEGRVQSLEAQSEEWRRRAAEIEQDSSVKRIQFEHQLEEIRRELSRTHGVAQEEAARAVARVEADFSEKKVRYETEIASLNDQLARVRMAATDDVARVQKAFDADINEKRNRYETEIASLNEQLTRVKAAAQEESTRLQVRVESEFSERRRKLEEEISTLRAELTFEKSNAQQEVSRERAAAQDELARERSSAQAEIARERTSAQMEIAKERTAAQAEGGKARMEAQDQIERFRAESESRMRALQARLDWYDANANREYDAARQKVQVEIETLEARYLASERTLEDMKAAEVQRMQILDDSRQANARADEQREAAMNDLVQAKNEWRRAELETEAHVRELTARFEDEKHRSQAAQESRAAIEHELRQQSETMSVSQKVVEVRDGQIEDLKSRLVGLHQELETERERFHSVESDLDRAKETLRAYGDHSVDDMKVDLERKTIELEEIRAKLATVSDQARESDKRQAVAEEKEEIFKDLINEKERTLGELKSKIGALGSEAQAAQEDVRRLQDKIRQQESGAGQTVMTLEREMEKIERKLSDERERLVRGHREDLERISAAHAAEIEKSRVAAADAALERASSTHATDIESARAEAARLAAEAASAAQSVELERVKAEAAQELERVRSSMPVGPDASTIEAEVRQQLENEFLDKLRQIETQSSEGREAGKKELEKLKWEADNAREELRRSREARTKVEREANDLLRQAEAHFKKELEKARAEAPAPATEQTGGIFSKIGRFLDSPVIEIGGKKKAEEPPK